MKLMASDKTTCEIEPLQLERFLPYRLSVLSNTVSRAVAQLYEDRFDLKLPEWRVMAVLGRFPGRTASEIVETTAMDKVAISRAVKRLVDMGRVTVEGDPRDARRQRLSLSARGHAIYRQVVPLARSVEERLLATLSPADRDAIDRMLTRLTAAAGDLASPVIPPAGE